MINKRFKKGFTLIELLIVIAILGTLAVVVLLALNPVQQLARTRDAGRIQTVTSLGHAIEANATANNGVYMAPPATASTWVTQLVTAGEISQVPAQPAYGAAGVGGRPTAGACSVGTNNQNGWCYARPVASRAYVYAALESGAQNSRCTGTNVAWAMYSTANGSGGVVCTTDYTTAPATTGIYTICNTTPCPNNQLIQ